MKNHIRIMKLCKIALFAALLCVSAWIHIPTPIPITLQTLALFVLADCLSYEESAASVLVYLALGIFGVPVFAGFQSGIGTLLGPTGGFLIGYLPTVLLYSSLSKLTYLKRMRFLFALLALIVLYFCGGIWYSLVYGGEKVLSLCVYPFIVPDVVKILFAIAVSTRLKRMFR